MVIIVTRPSSGRFVVKLCSLALFLTPLVLLIIAALQVPPRWHGRSAAEGSGHDQTVYNQTVTPSGRGRAPDEASSSANDSVPALSLGTPTTRLYSTRADATEKTAGRPRRNESAICGGRRELGGERVHRPFLLLFTGHQGSSAVAELLSTSQEGRWHTRTRLITVPKCRSLCASYAVRSGYILPRPWQRNHIHR